MNNTKTSAMVAVFIAATLVVAGTFAATHSAFAYLPKKDNKKEKERDGGNDNGNTVTAQINKQKAYQSGFDNDQSQESENVICTHPGSNSSCVSEAASVISPSGNQTGGGGGGGGGGGQECTDGRILVTVSGTTPPLGGLQVCVLTSLLTPPNSSGACTGGLILVTATLDDSTLRLCIAPGVIPPPTTG
jgi:hypothetical protein